LRWMIRAGPSTACDTMPCCVMPTNNRTTSTPSNSLLSLRAIHLTRRQFVFLYKMVQISTLILPPPRKKPP
jgi:hypothetical protein